MRVGLAALTCTPEHPQRNPSQLNFVPSRNCPTTCIPAVSAACAHGAASTAAGGEEPSTDSAAASLVLPAPPNLHGKAARKQWNALALAFLGDGVWEMYARRRFFYPPTRMADYYAAVVDSVRAEAQEAAFVSLSVGSFLTADERDVLRWGRNATGTTPKRMGRGIKKETYRAASAVETLAGYLYLTNPERLHQLMAHLGLEPPEQAGVNGRHKLSTAMK